jgi:hypothetical protein
VIGTIRGRIASNRMPLYTTAVGALCTFMIGLAVSHCSGPNSGEPSTADSAPASVDGGKDDASRHDAALSDAKVPEAADLGPPILGCTPRPGWNIINPLRLSCAAQMAPPEAWAAAALPMVPCQNGQVGCTQLVIPILKGSGQAAFFERKVGAETDAFEISYYGDSAFQGCRTALRILPNSYSYSLSGAVEVNTSGLCQAIPVEQNGMLAFSGTKADFPPLKSRTVLTPWSKFAPIVEVEPLQGFTLPYRTRDKLFLFDYNLEIIDIPTGRIQSNVPVPPKTGEWFPEFAALGSVWGTALFGVLGKGEIWQINAQGQSIAMRQDPNVHMFALATDGTTLFWAQGSGNNTSWQDQPKIELWAATASTDPAVVTRTARRLADVSGGGNVLRGAAHGGYYLVNVGNREFAVVRARDGALQRITLAGDWSSIYPTYVDATQAWFGHAARIGASPGVARVKLAPWPP